MKKIPLTRGKVALVDDADFDWLNQWKWFAFFSRGKWYAARSQRLGERKMFLMHREILQTPEGLEADHEDGDGLNNQRFNLRLATHKQNCANVRARKNRSGFKGVTTRLSGRFFVRIAGRYIGDFQLSEEAARAYDAAAKKEFGEFARLNFPEKQQT